jgi:thioredoxin reductase (NADPH)
MDFLANYESLLFVIAVFLILVVALPFVLKEIKKKNQAKKLINRIIPVSSLTEEDIGKIQSLHPEGKKLYPVINRSKCVGCGTCVMNCKEKYALYVINGKSTLVNPLACRCRGDCERNCLTGALKVVEYGKHLKVTIPQTDENYESNIKGIYIVGALNGAGLIKEAINQGRAAVNHIMKDVYPPKLPKVIVAGAGPAGLSAMLSCRKFGLPVDCIEKEIAANTIRNFPKKKILMAEPVEMPIFGPLWIGDTTRENLLAAWDRILKKTGVRIDTNLRLEQVEKHGDRFVITASGKQLTCDKVILALGNRGVPRKLDVPGEDNPNVFYNLLDAEEFEGNAVTIVGAGDSAIEAALSLRQHNCTVTMIVRGDGFPRAKLKNKERIDHAAAAKEISVYFNAKVNEINAGFITFSDMEKTYRIKNGYVFVMVGGELPFQLLEKIGINLIEIEI